MNKELPKVYEPQEVEGRIYEMWEKNGCFQAHRDPDKKPFTIVMPPPNVTGQLHMGHAMDSTLQDILIRFKRMQGYAALWVPGTDHAGIATQIKVEEALRNEEGLTRYDLGREKFLERVWDWKEKYGGRIVQQQKKLGASCDWSRARFTMDDGLSAAVRHVFVKLYDKGLIYKGSRIINWCPHCVTALSDAEVEYQDKPGSFWHLRYPIKGEEGRFVIVATTRPETMLGDTGVAVNPNDDRYKDLVGKTCILPLVGREMPIVADEYVDMEFGTGCVKMTPAHDPNDFEVGLRHDLESIRVLDDEGKVVEGYGRYSGLDRYEARKAIVQDLEEGGYLVKVEPHQHNVGTCYRCHSDVEPLISAQWFVKMEPLAQEALRVVNDGEVKFVPDRFSKTYTNWMENVHDWCISRQLWWGHRIPAWYCDDCGRMTVSETDPTECQHCHSQHIHQEEDVLDTWFSSALWPFSTLGWPEKTEDLDYFYPTDVLVTGYDIIFFWVIRMVFSGYEQTGKRPFHTVLIHGLVRDSQGRKMSKSLGNGIDPLEVIDKDGADALRMTLITGNAPGNDMRFYWERVENSRNFANKVWNASRFIMMNMQKAPLEAEAGGISTDKLTMADRWILSKANTLAADVTENLDKYELGIALQKVYDFIWEEFCDWYIEMVKPRLYNEEDTTKAAAIWTLKTVLIQALKLLHPFMPFITEEIFCNLQEEEQTVMISKWPEYQEQWSFKAEEKATETIKEAVRAIRNVRTSMNVPPSKKATVYVVSEDEELLSVFEHSRSFFATLGYAGEVVIQKGKEGIASDAVSAVIPKAAIYMPFADLVDIEKEIERLKGEEKRLAGELARSNGMLNNEKFISRAPQDKIDAERAKMENYAQMMEQVKARLAQLLK